MESIEFTVDSFKGKIYKSVIFNESYLEKYLISLVQRGCSPEAKLFVRWYSNGKLHNQFCGKVWHMIHTVKVFNEQDKLK